MARVPLALGKKSDKAKAPAESVERLLNCYLEVVPEGKEPTPIYGTGGLKTWASGLEDLIRGGMEMGEQAYVVAGTRLYRMAAGGTSTDLGQIPGTDNVSMAGDGTNVVVVAGGHIFVWNGSAVSVVTDPDAPLASSVLYVDGFYVFTEQDTEQWFISALRDPVNYDALDFASAEWKPDKLVAAVKLKDTLWLAGKKTFEAQQNTGDPAFPFSAYKELKIDTGLIGRDAITTTNDTMFWLADDLTVRRLDGLTATLVSTAAVGRTVKAWADPSLTVASTYVWDHHLFVKLRNPDGCVVYDQTTDRWHDEESHEDGTWRGRHLISCYGKLLFGSATEGKIFELSDTTYTDDGDPQLREIVTPFGWMQGKRFTVTEVELVCQTGVGSPTLDPRILCERSKDGQVWTGAKVRRLGKQGVTKRVLFGGQGQARQMAFRFRCSDDAKFAAFGAYVEMDAEA